MVDDAELVDWAELLVVERVEPVVLVLCPELLPPTRPNSAYMLYDSRGDCCIAAKENVPVGLVGKKPDVGEEG